MNKKSLKELVFEATAKHNILKDQYNELHDMFFTVRKLLKVPEGASITEHVKYIMRKQEIIDCTWSKLT